MNDIIPIKGHIYLQKMYDSSNDVFVYKVGKSINIYKLYELHHFEKILTFIISDNITHDKFEIINLFNMNCTLHKGRDFFTATDDDFVLSLFLSYFRTQNYLRLLLNNSMVENRDSNVEHIL
jgi:hypothetical protein